MNFKGIWTLNLDSVKRKMPNFDFNTNPYSVLGLGSNKNIDDFSINGELEVLPIKNNLSEVEKQFEDGDIIVCMMPQVEPKERLLTQRGWHSEMFFRNLDNRLCIGGVVGGDTIQTRGYGEDVPEDWISNVFRVEFPKDVYSVEKIRQLKNQVRIWRTIYNKYKFPPNMFIDKADFLSKVDLKKNVNALLSKTRDGFINDEYVTCVQWAYEILCLSLCYPLSIKYLEREKYLENVKANYPEIIKFLPEEEITGVDDIPIIPYTPAQVIQASLDMYFDKVPMIQIFKDKTIKRTFVDAIRTQLREGAGKMLDEYIEEVIKNENISQPMIVNGKPYTFIYPSIFHAEARKNQVVSKPYVRYVATIVNGEYANMADTKKFI